MKEVGPVLVVAGVISVQSRPRHVLLAKRHSPHVPDANHRWECPGGKVEFGETLEQALKRELQEELNIDVSVGKLLGAVSNQWDHIDDRTRHHNVIIGFACEVKRDNFTNTSTARYMSKKMVDALDERDILLPGTAHFLSLSRIFV